MAADGVTITGVVNFQKLVKEVFELPEKEIKGVLRGAAKLAAPEILTHHYEKNKGTWKPIDPEYAKRKGNSEQLVNTGNMMKGIKGKTAPASLRKLTVAKIKKKGYYRISIALRKIVNGKNVYTYAQKGTAKSANLKGFFGQNKTVSLGSLKKRKSKVTSINRDGSRMVCQNEPGDEKFFASKIEEALRIYLAKKAKKLSK